MIVTVSPHPLNRHETLNTISYGSRAKMITNNAQINKEKGLKEMRGFKKLPIIPQSPSYVKSPLT